MANPDSYKEAERECQNSDIKWILGPVFLLWQKTLTERFLVDSPLKILAASTYMIDFFCKSTAASNFCNDRKSALNLAKQHRRSYTQHHPQKKPRRKTAEDKTSELSKHWFPDLTLARNEVIMNTTYPIN